MADNVINKKIIDMVRIHDIFGDDDEAIREFFLGFIDATLELLKDLEKAIATEDVQIAKIALHRLKGSAGNSGVMGIHKLSIKAEEKVNQNDWVGVENLYQDILKIFNILQKSLTKPHLHV